MSESRSLTKREREILFYVVSDFIQRGEAVPSSLVAESGVVDVSSATIRNVMSVLEDTGFLSQPHTSAGRVPTPQGVREYVNLLVETPLALRDLASKPALEWGDDDMDGVARQAGLVLSELSRMAGLVLGPELRRVRLRDVRLVRLDERRVLTILVCEDRRVVERVCFLDEPIDSSTLEKTQNYLSELAAGCTIGELQEKVRRGVERAQDAYRQFVRHAMELSDQLDDESRTKLHVEGLLNFLEYEDLVADVQRLRDLMRAVEERERLLKILEKLESRRGPITVIGPELGDALGDELSLVVCGYYQGDEPVGLVGVLGPIRMDYSRMIPLVDHVAGVLTRELEG